jgi:hypothetical protein
MNGPPETDFNPNTKAIQLIDKLAESCACKTLLQEIREEVLKVEYNLWSANETRAFIRWRHRV